MVKKKRWIPFFTSVQGFLQHHAGWSAILKGECDVVNQLQTFVPWQTDVGQQWLRIPGPCDRLPVGDEASPLPVSHQLWWVRQVRAGGITFITAEVWVLLQHNENHHQSELELMSRKAEEAPSIHSVRQCQSGKVNSLANKPLHPIYDHVLHYKCKSDSIANKPVTTCLCVFH